MTLHRTYTWGQPLEFSVGVKDALCCFLVDQDSQLLFAFEWQDLEYQVKTQHCLFGEPMSNKLLFHVSQAFVFLWKDNQGPMVTLEDRNVFFKKC